MFSCSYCPQTFPTIYLRDQHIQNFHRGMGWYEGQQPMVNDKSGKVELRALEHSIAATREKLEKERPLAKPIPAPMTRPQPEQLTPSQGWKKLLDNSYVFEKEVYQHNTPFDSLKIVLEATLNQKHGKCIKHEFTRDLRELNRLQEKQIIMESRLAQLIPSDYKFGDVAKELNDVTIAVNKLTNDVRPDDERHELVFEDYYRYDSGTEEQIKWMKSFMDKVVSESERLAENHKKVTEFKET